MTGIGMTFAQVVEPGKCHQWRLATRWCVEEDHQDFVSKETTMVTRDILLYLAKQEYVRDFIMRFGLSRRAALRFVCGEDTGCAVRAVAELSQQGVLATLDHLGENVVSADDARQAANDYLAVLDEIANGGVQSHVSLKLTQMGLDIGEDYCQSLVAEILDLAAQHDNFARIDMECSDYTDRTLSVFRNLRASHTNVGIVIQACLYRSA
jgi:proline dehydrogenase